MSITEEFELMQPLDDREKRILEYGKHKALTDLIEDLKPLRVNLMDADCKVSNYVKWSDIVAKVRKGESKSNE